MSVPAVTTTGLGGLATENLARTTRLAEEVRYTLVVKVEACHKREKKGESGGRDGAYVMRSRDRFSERAA